MTQPEQHFSVTQAVAQRRSVRAFTDQPVDLTLLRTLIERAARAPSGGNLQPWHIHIVSGDAMTRLKTLMAVRVTEAPMGECAEYAVYPPHLGERFNDRRKGVGAAMYDALGIERGDLARRQAVFAENFQFFGAPVGLFCTVERDHGPPQWSDCGMYLQTLMLLLVEAGLDSCAQEAWALWPRTVGDFLRVPDSQMLFTGMAIGYRDGDAAVNNWSVPRAATDEFATFHQ
ncbi:nitroreductase family protein [Sphingomonas sp. AX6]|uniref:nitroreductase family protein n=1 Tax=Sphingomonas sp. AX6 TaxID=2653171 RepID=UPI0012F0276C|nr:nitroreductase family protein [Sphingomonas sp. AX6]VXC42875.1 p-nitrobenzoate reductase NfnB [Sphingomonas sp. AX6]